MFFIFILVFSVNLLKISYAFFLGYHYDLIREVMRKEGFSKDAFSVSLLGNSYVDIFQVKEVEYIINDNFCRVSKKLVNFLHFDGLYNEYLIDAYFRQLIFNTYNAVYEKAIKNDKLGLLLIIGISMHIIQDFYAHSNWVELELNKYSGIKDATYFDILLRDPDSFEKAIQIISSYGGMYGKTGLFTHFYQNITHESLNKDYAGRPYFDWAYRCAYKASLEWLRLIKKWILDIKGLSFWNELLRYEFKEGDKKHLYTLTDFDEGTIRYLCIYAGAWKAPRMWSWLDVLADYMPNVPGIGLLEQCFSTYPFLGIEWFSNCFLIAKDLFKATGIGSFRKLSNVENLELALKDKNNFGKIVKVNYEDYTNITPIKSDFVNDAFDFMSKSALDYENNVFWLRIRIPEVMDLDTGEGWININNEEPAGISDYWVMFFLNDEVDYPYTESEYMNKSHFYPVWGVLKPLWDKNPVKVQIRMYESDPGFHGTYHKDEEMDISPDPGKSLIFTFDPNNISNLKGFLYPQGCSCWWIDKGRYMKSSGTGELRARIYVKAWLMSDIREELMFPVLYNDCNCDNEFLPILNDLSNLKEIGFNDKVSSIFVPHFWKIQVFENTDYSERSLILDRTIEDLNKNDFNMNDKISSVKILQFPHFQFNLFDFPEFYEDKNFEGVFLKLPYTLPNNSTCGFYSTLSLYNFNDRISSIKVPLGWKIVIYENSHFEGKSMELTSSVNDLSSLGWNDRISSIRLIPPVSITSQTLEENAEKISGDFKTLTEKIKIELKNFPEKFINSDFMYKRSDLKIPEDLSLDLDINYAKVMGDWAYLEVSLENYILNVLVLFHKENREWFIKEIISPNYVVCEDKNEGMDVLNWIFIRLMQKYGNIPKDLFPKISPEREILLAKVKDRISNLIDSEIVYVVTEYRVENDLIKIGANPRSLDGLRQYESIKVIFRKEGDIWNLADFRFSEDF